MRYLLVTVILISVWGCDKPADIARREVARVVTMAHQLDRDQRVVVPRLLVDIAHQEHDRRIAAMQAAGCTTTSTTQPASAPAQCHVIAKSSLDSYEARCAKVRAAVRKVEDSIIAIYEAVPPALTAIATFEGGWAQFKDVRADIGKLTKLGLELAQLYEAVKQLVAGGGR